MARPAIGHITPMTSGGDPETVRQRLRRLLSEEERDFEALREELELSPRELEAHLRHLERSVRGDGGRLEVTPPSCRACGFAFTGRGTRRMHRPGRCPACRNERVDPPRFRVVR